MACKFVEGSEREGYHNLIDVHNRGRLWKAKRDVVLIFTLAESLFLYSTLSYGNVINIKRILNEGLSNINTKVINTFN